MRIPIDKWIEVDGHALQIVGVMDRPANPLPGQDDTRVLVPYFTMQKMFPSAQENMLVVIAYPGMVTQAEDEIRAVLRLTRRVPFNAPDTFSMATAEQLVEQFHSITAMVALVMVILSSIGLLVGGIGVMNIMLVSVTERTREIGIRKAIGARKSDIIVQFLTEAVVLDGARRIDRADVWLDDFARRGLRLPDIADGSAVVGGGRGRGDVGRRRAFSSGSGRRAAPPASTRSKRSATSSS